MKLEDLSKEELIKEVLKVRNNNRELNSIRDSLELKLLFYKDKNFYQEFLDEKSIIAITDKNGVITYANNKFCEISGYSRDELLGKTHRLVNSGYHDKKFFEDLWGTISSGNEWRGEICNRSKNGTLYWVDTFIKPELDENDNPIKYYAFRIIITEKKETERQIANLQREYETIFNGTQDALFMVEVSGEKEFYFSRNNAMHEMLTGLTTEIMRGKSPIELLGDELGNIVSQNYKKCIDARETITYEEALELPGGKRDWITSLTPIETEGKIRYIIGSSRDITTRKKYESLLSRQNIAMKNSANGIFITDSIGKIVWVNPAFEKISGYSEAETLGAIPNKLLKSGVHPKSFYSEMWDTIRNGETWKGEITNKHKNGNLYIIETTITPFYDENEKATYFIAMQQDITERKKAELALKESEERFTQLANSIDSIFWLRSGDNTRMLYISPAYEKIFGRTVQSLYDNPDSFIEAIHNEDRQKVIEEYQKESQGHPFNLEYRIVRPDGSFRWIWARSYPVSDANGQICRFAGSAEDITDNKNAETALRKSQENLKRLNAEKDKFFSIIAHDLRNPFSGFLGLTKTLVEDLHNLTINEIQELTRELQISANTLYKLLENLLEWSRMQRQAIDFRPDNHPLEFLIKQNIDIISLTSKNKDISISSDIESNIYVYADIKMIDTVMRNLLSNAVKFTPRGGSIEIGAIQIKRDENNDFVKVSIKDSGIGMDADTIEKLFKIDQKVSRPGTENEPSTGLGLLLCKEYIDKNNGQIWVESKVGQGTIFNFTLPIGKQEEYE